MNERQLLIGFPYEKDCYLGAPLESQTTNPNHQFYIGWESGKKFRFTLLLASFLFLQWLCHPIKKPCEATRKWKFETVWRAMMRRAMNLWPVGTYFACSNEWGHVTGPSKCWWYTTDGDCASGSDDDEEHDLVNDDVGYYQWHVYRF